MKKTNNNTILRDNRGELVYVGTAITTLIILIMLAFILNIFSFLTLKQDMEYMCEQLIEISAFAGCTDEFSAERFSELCSELGFDESDFTLSFDGSDYIPGTSNIQYGDTIIATITCQKSLVGFGIADIPVTVTSKCSGISEKYFK